MVKRQMFTDPFIRALKPKARPYKLAEHAARGEGRLIVRVLPSGSREFFYRYRPDGEDKTLALGRYDQTGRNGKTLAGIRKTLRERRELQRETGDVKEHLKQEARRQQVENRRGSLAQLLQAYVAHLRHEGKAESANDAENIFKNHVTKAFPLIAQGKASEATGDDIRTILAKMVKAGITRQVNKARAYLGAAFSYGAEADHDPRTLAKDGVLFGIKANPVSLVPVIREYERTLERTLSEAEIREFWKGLGKLPMVQAATIRFNLALACQRPTQLLRADWPDFDVANTLLLRDAKGRGGSRDHLLPLTAFALAQFKPLRQLNLTATTPFSSNGTKRLSVDTLTKAVADVSADLALKKEFAPFQQRDLRRTAETMLQKMGIDKEVRAHLLSHGRSKGVQGKHYERYDFLKEKREALEQWADQLQRIIDPSRKAKVVQIGKR